MQRLSLYKKELACALILFSPSIVKSNDTWKSDQQNQVQRELAELKKQKEREKKVIKAEPVKKDNWQSDQQIKMQKELAEIRNQKIVTFNGKKYDLKSEKDWAQLKDLLPEDDEALYNRQYKDEEDAPGRRVRLLREKSVIVPKLSPDQKKDLELGTHKERVNFIIDKLLSGATISEAEWNKAKESCKIVKLNPKDPELECKKYIIDKIILKYKYNKAKMNDYSEMAYKKDESIAEEHKRIMLIGFRDIPLIEQEKMIKEFKEQRRKDIRKGDPKIKMQDKKKN